MRRRGERRRGLLRGEEEMGVRVIAGIFPGLDSV